MTKTRVGVNNPNWKGEARKTRRQIRRDYYLRHKDTPEYKAKALANRLKYGARISQLKATWKENNPALNIWSNAKYRAKRRGLEFDLEPSDIIIPKKCPYLGVTLTSHKLRGHLDTHMSLDRVDSTKGYVKGNVEVISYKANMMKQNATPEQLITFAESILRRLK